MMRQVVQRAGRAPCRLHVVSVAHRSHQGGDHLRRVHDGVAASLLLRELVDHHRGLADDHLVLVVEELGQFGDGARRQVSIVLSKRTDMCHANPAQPGAFHNTNNFCIVKYTKTPQLTRNIEYYIWHL